MVGPSTVKWFVGAVLVVATLAGRDAGAEPRRADPKSQESARSYYERATSAFGLGDYARAADLYEKAFELRADSALLYNAAQSHRLAGHKERALQLYQNYVRLFPDSRQTGDARRHMAELQDGATGSLAPLGSPELGVPDAVGDVPASRPRSGPATPASPPSNLALTSPPPPPGAGPPAAGSDLTKPASPPGDATTDGRKRPRTWLWITVGGAVVVAGAVTTAVLLSGKPHDPTPSLGTVGGTSMP
jgi:hypothetical protein